MSSSAYVNSIVFNGNKPFTDGTNTYKSYSSSTSIIYKITETEPGTLTYQSVSVKSYPSQGTGINTARAFSLGLNAKKGDARARKYISTIF